MDAGANAQDLPGFVWCAVAIEIGEIDVFPMTEAETARRVAFDGRTLDHILFIAVVVVQLETVSVEEETQFAGQSNGGVLGPVGHLGGAAERHEGAVAGIVCATHARVWP